MSERVVYVVPHTHWDREWYQPHELFRWRLVQMIDELLAHMDAHPEYRCFNLDGQSIVIEDYLALRPENEGRLRALSEAGRIVGLEGPAAKGGWERIDLLERPAPRGNHLGPWEIGTWRFGVPQAPA